MIWLICQQDWANLADIFFWMATQGFIPVEQKKISLFKQTIQFLQQNNVKNVMSTQYTKPGFEHTNMSCLP